jgi:hypothetical protein
VAGYGRANWVLNTRASGAVTLNRGGRAQKYKVDEAGAEIRVTRPYFAANPNSSDEAVGAELGRHAVFRLVPHGVR